MVGVPARQVGYAMAALKSTDDVPWHRVVNSQGKISLRGGGEARQRLLLEGENVEFDDQDRVDLAANGWSGPGWAWLEQHGFEPAPILRRRPSAG
jgi:methylated-DNA-protein-cysteine methyltransferase related protein